MAHARRTRSAQGKGKPRNAHATSMAPAEVKTATMGLLMTALGSLSMSMACLKKKGTWTLRTWSRGG